ncbi:glycosyltransferase [Paenibacillus sp. IITD108]|uniref:glycosyltransferase n=1 Tax=Paenibacillus sp. IITD108 TaxID=3116649 RepID=UPI002F3F63EC
MTKTPTILHHKHSMEDGHVSQQIISVEGYRGLMMIDKASEIRKKSPHKTILLLKAIKAKPALLKKSNVVGVHIHHGSLAPKFQFLKLKHKLPLFVSFRGNDATAYPKKKKNLSRLKQLFKTADLFFPVCHHLKETIMELGCPESKIRVLYGGLDLDRFEYRARKFDANKTIRFLAVGRFVEKKGFTDLLHAFAEVKKYYSNIKLTLIGKGPLESEYRKLIKKYSLQKNVEIIPWVNYKTIQEQYYRAHIFCAPSCTDKNGNQEGIPNTLKEAMATGLPVISTTHAGIPELVTDRVSGLLVPEGAISKLTDAMLWLIGHPERWEDFGTKAREKINTDFNLKIQLQKQKQFYEEILHQQKKKY